MALGHRFHQQSPCSRSSSRRAGIARPSRTACLHVSASTNGAQPVLLEVKDLQAKIVETGQQILNGVSLSIRQGEVHAIMGKNGSGKSTLSKVLVGHPDYEVTGGTATYKGKNLFDLEPEERSHEGLFLSFQSPIEIPGVSNVDFLRMACNARRKALGQAELDPLEFYAHVIPKVRRGRGRQGSAGHEGGRVTPIAAKFYNGRLLLPPHRHAAAQLPAVFLLHQEHVLGLAPAAARAIAAAALAWWGCCPGKHVGAVGVRSVPQQVLLPSMPPVPSTFQLAPHTHTLPDSLLLPFAAAAACVCLCSVAVYPHVPIVMSPPTA